MHNQFFKVQRISNFEPFFVTFASKNMFPSVLYVNFGLIHMNFTVFSTLEIALSASVSNYPMWNVDNYLHQWKHEGREKRNDIN